MANDIERVEIVPKLPPRAADGHKGVYGHALIVGGSVGMIGALAMATNACLRGGIGLATFAGPRAVQFAITTLCPCATSVPLDSDDAGELLPGAVRQVRQAWGKCNVLAVGPGFGVGQLQKDIVRAVLEQERPVVLDADGLNNLSQMADWPTMRRCPLVLTPHPGEFARLTGGGTGSAFAGRCSSCETRACTPATREEEALQAARSWAAGGTGTILAGEAAARENRASPPDNPLVLVLKGQGTVVTDGRRVYVNDTGNPGMATGGTGDVLTGLIAGVIGQGVDPFDAACIAVRAHGRAGDLAATKLGMVSMIATDLLDYLPAAMIEATS